MGRTHNMHKEDENTYTISLRIPERKRPQHTQEHNISIDLKQIHNGRCVPESSGPGKDQ